MELEKFPRGVVEGFFQSAVSKSLKRDFRCDAPLAGKGVLDVRRIEETRQILVGHAIKFSNGGTVEIGVRQRHSGAVLELSIADEGIGIPEAQQAKVFDSFFQVDQNLTRKYAGAGSTFLVALPGKIEAEGRFVAGDEPDGAAGPAENAAP